MIVLRGFSHGKTTRLRRIGSEAGRDDRRRRRSRRAKVREHGDCTAGKGCCDVVEGPSIAVFRAEAVGPIISWDRVPAWQRGANRILEETKVGERAGGGRQDLGLWESEFIISLIVKATIERYKRACTVTSNSGSLSEADSQYYQQESTKLRQQIISLQNSNRNLMGESLGSMSPRDLKQLEGRLEKGINKIRTKKNELLFAEIEYMQKREVDLQNDNMYLRNKIAENERAQQQMNMLPQTSEYEVMAPYDSRNFLQVNLMQSNQHYSHQQQTTLQLG